MSENTSEQGDEPHGTDDESSDRQLAEPHAGEIDEDEERRRQLADEEDAE